MYTTYDDIITGVLCFCTCLSPTFVQVNFVTKESIASSFFSPGREGRITLKFRLLSKASLSTNNLKATSIVIQVEKFKSMKVTDMIVKDATIPLLKP